MRKLWQHTHNSRIGCTAISDAHGAGARSCVNSLHKEFEFLFSFQTNFLFFDSWINANRVCMCECMCGLFNPANDCSHFISSSVSLLLLRLFFQFIIISFCANTLHLSWIVQNIYTTGTHCNRRVKKKKWMRQARQQII